MEKLKKHCTVISGYAFKSEDLHDQDEIPVVKIGNISNGKNIVIDKGTQYVSKDFLSIDEKYHIKKGDILISLTGSHLNQPNSIVGRSCRSYNDDVYLLNQRAGKVICKDNTDLDYMYYLLSTKAMKDSIVNRAYGAANQVNVSPTDIMDIKWDFVDYKQQKKIGKILSKYDYLIALNTKRIKLLEQMAENLYKEWFVRFRFPGHEKAEFENGIPKGWLKQRLYQFGITLDSGSRPSGGIDESLEIGAPSLGAEAISDLGEFDFSKVKLIPFEYYNKMKCGKNGEKDILIYKDGAYIGKTTIFMNDFPFSSYAVNEHVFLLNSTDAVYQYYLYFTLHQKEYFELMQNLNRNAAQPGLSQSDINRIKIVVPDKKVVIEFNKLIQPIFDLIFEIAKQKQYLTKQRDLLLPRLMSGKLEV